MGTRMQHVVVYGVVMTGEQAHALFEIDDEEENYVIPGAIESGYKITADHKKAYLVSFEDSMSGKYMILGRVIDYANDDDGDSLRITKFGLRESSKIEEPIDLPTRLETVGALEGAGLSREFINDNLTYMVFTHYR